MQNKIFCIVDASSSMGCFNKFRQSIKTVAFLNALQKQDTENLCNFIQLPQIECYCLQEEIMLAKDFYARQKHEPHGDANLPSLNEFLKTKKEEGEVHVLLFSDGLFFNEQDLEILCKTLDDPKLKIVAIAVGADCAQETLAKLTKTQSKVFSLSEIIPAIEALQEKPCIPSSGLVQVLENLNTNSSQDDEEDEW